MQNIAENLYKGTGELGRFYATITLIVSILLFVLLLSLGIVLVRRKTKYSKYTEATLVRKDLNANTCLQKSVKDDKGNDIITYNCDLTVSYTVDGKTYEQKLHVGGSSDDLTKKDKINVYYDPENPTDCSYGTDNSHVLGWVLVGLALLIITGAVIHYYVVNRFRFVASAEGVAQTVNLVKNIM